MSFIPQMIYELENDDGMLLTGEKNEDFGDKPVPVPLCDKSHMGANPGLRDERPESLHGRVEPILKGVLS
jgi:hypothetical protein